MEHETTHGVRKGPKDVTEAVDAIKSAPIKDVGLGAENPEFQITEDEMDAYVAKARADAGAFPEWDPGAVAATEDERNVRALSWALHRVRNILGVPEGESLAERAEALMQERVDAQTEDPEVLVFTALDPVESERTYHFPEGKVTLRDVTALHVSERGTHLLETADGLKHIIPPGWLAITLDVSEWSA